MIHMSISSIRMGGNAIQVTFLRGHGSFLEKVTCKARPERQTQLPGEVGKEEGPVFQERQIAY